MMWSGSKSRRPARMARGLPDALFQVVDEYGEAFTEWTSGDKSHPIERFLVGSYRQQLGLTSSSPSVVFPDY